MSVALIAVDPKSIVKVIPGGPSVSFSYAEGSSVSGASVGWTSPDGAYTLFAVVGAVVPPGWTVTGSPSYAFSEDGTQVVETLPLSTGALGDSAAQATQKQNLLNRASRLNRAGRYTEAIALTLKANGVSP